MATAAAAAGARETPEAPPKAPSQTASQPAIGEGLAAALAYLLRVLESHKAVAMPDIHEIELGSRLIKGFNGGNLPIVKVAGTEIVAQGNVSHDQQLLSQWLLCRQTINLKGVSTFVGN